MQARQEEEGSEQFDFSISGIKGDNIVLKPPQKTHGQMKKQVTKVK